MRFSGIKVGFAVTGSHYTLAEVVKEAQRLVDEGAELYPMFSFTVDKTDTRFGEANHWKTEFGKLTKNPIISTIVEAEPIGPKNILDIIVVAPCTGNTIAKLCNGITDSPVLMAVKAHLRNQKPVVLAISTNDGLGINAKNVGLLLNMKNIYMVPFGQDNPFNKANSLVAHMDKIADTLAMALQGKQLQPLLMPY